jgi:preprotein translocase subunit SecD
MSKRLRFVVLLVVLAVGAVFLYPTVNWYFMVDQDMKDIAAGSREQIKIYVQQQAKDDATALAGLASSEPDSMVPEEYRYITSVAAENLRLVDRDVPRDWTVSAVLSAFQNRDELARAMEDQYRQQVLELKNQKKRIIQLGLDLSGGMRVLLEADQESLAERIGKDPSDEELTDAIDLALEILTNRIDQFGVTEPVIRREEGSNRIIVELPGDNDPERVNAFLMGKGSLNLQLVDDDATDQLLEFQQQYRTQNAIDWNPDFAPVPDFVAAGTEVRPYVQRDQYGIDQVVRYIVTRETDEAVLDGSTITEAQVSRHHITGRPTVNFVLNQEGADKFQPMSRDNVGTSLAIVMDGKVRAYAQISEEIPGGQVMMQGFDLEDANDISRVLRTAALPVDLEIISLQQVGASLGEDAIQAGIQAILLGFALVIVFIILYYLGSGLVATVGLMINMFMIIAFLSAFNLTLTLTSIAGLILTVGMAVDANVIIFERIKEEFRLGKSAGASIQAGYQKAFWTIMDANLTTFIAALFLSYLGTGPVQGFAVTLAVGIVFSVFSALFVTRLLFDFGTDVLKSPKLSISWRLK